MLSVSVRDTVENERILVFVVMGLYFDVGGLIVYR